MKKYLMIGFLLGLLILAGCSQEDTVEVESVFMGGTQGMIASFEPFGIQEGEVYTVYDTENFPIEVVVKNKGEDDIDPGDLTVKLKGINLADFDNILMGELTNSKKIEKISEFNKDGGEEIIDFTPTADARYKQKVIGFYQPDIFATIEYKYKTYLIVPSVCFKEDLSDTSVCEVREKKTHFVSGAPVTVDLVTEDAAGKGIMVLTVEISNGGGGKATTVGEAFDPRYNKVVFRMLTEPEKWECRSAGRENEARLIDNKATVICKLKEPLAAGSLYTKQIEMELEYVYQSIIQETIKIRESQS